MMTLLKFVFFICLIGAAIALCLPAKEAEVGLPPPVDNRRLARMIHRIENWDGKSRGAAGERGRMQWKEETWNMFSSKPFDWAEGGTVAAQLEVEATEARYVNWLVQACTTLGRRPTPYLVALIHSAGYGTVMARRVKADKKDYASRAENLYEDGA